MKMLEKRVENELDLLIKRYPQLYICISMC